MNAEHVKKLLDRLAYLSLGIDICIACISTFGIFNSYLETVDILLSVVVALSIVLFVTLLILKRVESQIGLC